MHQPLPSDDLEYLDPFVLLHHHKRLEHFSDMEIGAHPHKGFSPVTYVFEGRVHHRDSVGNDSTVDAGGVQWMNAASGIVHSEAILAGPYELVQLWINVPAARKSDQPSYSALQASGMPTVQGLRVASGSLAGVEGPVHPPSPVVSAMADLPAGIKVSVPLPISHNAFVYVLAGRLAFSDGTEATATELAVLSQNGEGVEFNATEDSRVLLVSGEPLNEPMATGGPFVMNSEAEIRQAYMDYRSGRMGSLH